MVQILQKGESCVGCSSIEFGIIKEELGITTGRLVEFKPSGLHCQWRAGLYFQHQGREKPESFWKCLSGPNEYELLLEIITEPSHYFF